MMTPAWLGFFSGTVVGCLAGVFVMCLLFISRSDD